jgi:hypothetical protein
MNQKAYGMQNLKQTSKTPQSPFNSRWNENGNMVHQKQPVQPELQLNMNSQGGFVPQFINHNRSESIPSPIQSDSSIQVPFPKKSLKKFEHTIANNIYFDNYSLGATVFYNTFYILVINLVVLERFKGLLVSQPITGQETLVTGQRLKL